MLKKDIRKQYLSERSSWSPDEIQARTQEMIRHMPELDSSKLTMVMSYYPMERYGEPDIPQVEAYLAKLNPAIQYCYPSIDGDDMYAVSSHYHSSIITNSFGTKELIDGRSIASTDIDIILVPLIAVDQRGYRVGFGKGYYDRFLSQCDDDTLIIGLGYSQPIPAIDDIHEHDIPIDIYITPSGIYHYS